MTLHLIKFSPELQGKSYAMKREKEQKLSVSLFIYLYGYHLIILD